MKLRWNEIQDLDTDLHFTQDDAWVRAAILRAEEESHSPPGASISPTTVDFTLRRVDDLIVVDGRFNTTLHLCCSRCANAFEAKVNQTFSTLYSKDPVMAGRSFLEEGSGKRAGQNFGIAKSAASSPIGDGATLASRDIDITYTEDLIELDDLLSEQMLLQVPFQPLCKESCKGLCSHCGADLNVGRCACAKIIKESPFSALKDLKLSEKIS